MRKILVIIAAIIVLAGTGIAVYYWYFAKPASIAVGPSEGATLPFAGNTGTQPTGDTGANPAPDQGGGEAPKPSDRLVQITLGPVVPGFALTEKGGTSTSSPKETRVSYIERQSGNVYTYSFAGGTITRTSNRTVPGIQSATWLPDAGLAFVQYLSGANSDTVNTYGLPANGVGGFFLPQNLSGLAVSSSSLLTLVSGVNGSIISVGKTDGSKSVEVASTPLSSVTAAFAGKSYVITTRATGTLPGAAYVFEGGSLRKVAGPLNGLATKVSPRGEWLLMSYTTDGAFRTDLVKIATGERITLPIATLVDKCVWAQNDSAVYCGVPVDPPKGQNYPDDWFQGAVPFADRIWRIDVSARYAQLIVDVSREAATPVDAVALNVNATQSKLVFMNRNDGSLWGYNL